MCLATAAGFRVSARFLSVVLTSCRPQALLMEIQVAHLPPSKSEECQRRFQAAVDVIQNLPKNGNHLHLHWKTQSKLLVWYHVGCVNYISRKIHCSSDCSFATLLISCISRMCMCSIWWAGSYRPSYEVMLRFYSLYKQAVCGPCTTSRPGFWDPVGRYKWWV